MVQVPSHQQKCLLTDIMHRIIKQAQLWLTKYIPFLLIRHRNYFIKSQVLKVLDTDTF